MADATTATVTCADCQQVLDEDPGQEPDARMPCPRCGSTRRLFHQHLTGEVHVTGTLRAVRIRESVERHWPWVAVLVALAVAGVLAKWVLPLWWSVAVAVVIVGLSVAVRPRASARLIERDHYPARD